MSKPKSTILLSIPLAITLGAVTTAVEANKPYYGDPLYPGWYPGKFPDPRKPQICKPESRTVTTPIERFTLNQDGTAIDKATDLMWMRCSLGHTWTGSDCTGDTHRSTWKVALTAVKTYNQKGGFAGYKDWRIPNIKELGSIVERACVHPTINLDIFPATEYWYYWSSTSSAGITEYVWKNKQQWGIDFSDGSENVANFTQRRLRLVRDPK